MCSAHMRSWFWRSVLFLVMELAVGCNVDSSLGSVCDGGVCSQALAQTESPQRCNGYRTDRVVGVVNAPEEPEHVLRRVCMGHNLVADTEGLVPCRAFWEASRNEAAPADCTGPAFVGQGEEPGQCELRQLQAQYGVEDAQVTGDGWFYSQAAELAENCALGGALTLVGEGIPREDGVLTIACEWATIDAADFVQGLTQPSAQLEVNPQGCAPLEPQGSYAAPQACALESTPAGGLTASDAYLEVDNPDCPSGLCLSYHASLDVGLPLCEPSEPRQCESERPCFDIDVEFEACVEPERLACTCRCDAPEPEAELCTCASDQVCVPIFEDGPLAGSYCVAESLVYK